MPTKTSPRRRSPPARRAPPRRRGFWQGAIRLLLVLVLLGGIAAGAALFVLWPRCSGAGCPSVLALRDYAPPQASVVLDRAGRQVASLAPEQRIVVPLSRVPAHVSGAFLAVEDKRFYQHGGVDWRRALGAALRDLKTLRYDQGFSTVTMQLARNVFPEQLSRAKTIRRKLWEMMLARRIERVFTKDEILALYLNQIYLGEGLYGVEAAARGYFGKPAARLSLAEAATLAALPKAPSYYDPRRNPEAARARRDVVLGLMARAGVTSEAEAARARSEPLRLAPPPGASGAAPYFVAAVRQELQARFGPDAETRGYRIFTTLDPALQKSAETALVAQIEAVEAGRFGRFRQPSCSGRRPASSARCLQGLFVALDARTGDVLALVGGRNYGLSQFDRARQARRQAGSAFKPIVYAAALQAGIPITTPLLSPGVDWQSESGYRPADHVADSTAVDLRLGLRVSSNRAAVALGERVGVDQVIQLARRLGITTPIQPYPSTFLGAADVVPLEMIASYAPFANGGARVRPRFIARVVDAAGREVYRASTPREYMLSPGVAFLTNSLMRDVVDRGTGAPARNAGGLPSAIPAAGKTGTTNGAADVWFIGATPDVVAGVWLGFDRPRTIVPAASGGLLAAPVWGRVLASYYARRPAPAPWAPPPEVVVRSIDRGSGMLATAACPPESVEPEYFLTGTEPTAECPLHVPVDPIGGLLDRVRGWFGGQPEQPTAPPLTP